ncbi:hypothetical protein ACFV00_28165 [Streptomyces californicus]
MPSPPEASFAGARSALIAQYVASEPSSRAISGKSKSAKKKAHMPPSTA